MTRGTRPASRGRSLTAARGLLGVAAGSLLVASLIHSGALLDGYRHQPAAIAEAVIGTVMLACLAATWIPGPWPRRAALAGFTFGLLGTLVGMFTIVIGVGPQSVADVVYHLALLAALAGGLVVSLRAAPTGLRGR